MVAVCPILYVWWKFVRIETTQLTVVGSIRLPIPYPRFGHFTHIKKPHEADITTGVAEVEEYTANYVPKPPKNELHRYGSLAAAKLHLW